MMMFMFMFMFIDNRKKMNAKLLPMNTRRRLFSSGLMRSINNSRSAYLPFGIR